MTTFRKFIVAIGKNLVASGTGRWHPKYPIEAYQDGTFSFSQCGEDLAAANILQSLNHEGPVHYVDVGCFQPIRFSNTYFSYLRGGQGLVIDLNDTHRAEFQRLRPRDIFVAALVSDSPEARFVRAKGHSNDAILSEKSQETGLALAPRSLESLLDEHWPREKTISLLDIDCEGHDLEVLRSNHWTKYRPKLVIVEDFSNDEDSPACHFMKTVDYLPIARLRCALFFVDRHLEVSLSKRVGRAD